MQVDTALDVAIGVSFTYLLLASLVSFIQECIAGIFKWRGTYLDKAIDVILNNDPNARFGWGGFGAWFTAHFLPWAPATQVTAASKDNGPRMPGGPGASAADIVKNLRAHPLLKNGPNSLPSYISAGSFASALLNVLRDGSSLPVFSQIERTINDLPEGDLKRILTGFVTAAAGDIDKLHARIESWFDAEMDRLSGFYKRASQSMMFVLAGVLAVGLNVNSLHLAKALWVEAPAQRAALVAAANSKIAGATDPKTFASDVTTSLTTLDDLELPIGWPKAPALLDLTWFNFAGWLITMFAITLGAPFWFDIAQNFVNLRNAGPRPASNG